jgi:DNA-binding CsgD family transcriptional regulator
MTSSEHQEVSEMIAATLHNAVAHALSPSPQGRSQRLAALGHCLMERLDMPLFVTDAEGAVLEANSAARRRAERREGLWLDAGGRLSARVGGRWVPLSRWRPEINAGREVTAMLDTEGAPVQLVLRPMAVGDSGAPSVGAGWVMASIERVALNRGDAMRRRFRFTETQARLAEMLCQGMRPTSAAQALGVKISTVRTHVSQMYEKTGTNSQAQLVALLHGC